MTSNGVGKFEYIESIMNKYGPLDVLRNKSKQSVTKLELGSSFCFQHDKDPKHTAEIVKLWLLYNIPNHLHTPPQSPHLNPIEHLWDSLERRICQYNTSSKDMLKSALKDKWEKMNAKETTRLVQSMPTRVREVFKRRVIQPAIK
ncbi:transposable element Tc1 transposase [Trichonephila clavipes]|nr:transposable element Tc1 transposase [Trichonephila clavipes]